MPWVMNAQTGQYEWHPGPNETDQPWQTPVGPVAGARGSPGEQFNAEPPSPSWARQSPRSNGQAAGSVNVPLIGEVGRHESGRLLWPWENRREAPAPAAPAPDPSIDFGELQVAPEVQAYIDALGQIGTGGTAMPERVPIPAPTPMANDPGLALLAEGAQQRGKQQLGLLEEMRADLQRDNPEGRSAWLRLGEWLGMVGERGWENAGGAMHEMLARDREAARALRNEAYQLMLAGFGVDEAMTQAQANLLSGNHQTAMANQQAQYQTDVANAHGENQWALGGWQASQQQSARQAAIAAQIAEATMNAQAAARQERQALLQPFLGMPGYEDDAIQGMYGDRLPPEALSALTQNLVGDERAALIYQHVASMNPAQAASLLRRFDPGINQAQFERDPAGTVLRALQGPNAEAIYREISPSLRLSQRFGRTEE